MIVKKCPNCKSLNLGFSSSLVSDEVTCNDCGYRGMVVIEEDEE